jgi:thiol-disulfide isomerase/thioredoxin
MAIRRRLRWAPPLAALALLLLGACGLGRPAAAGSRLPALTAATLAGEEIALAGAPRQALWLSFWASWCAPCREEWPDINAAARSMGADVRIVAVAVSEPADVVAAFVAEHPADMIVALDPEAELADQLAVAGLPTHILVGADGVVRHVVRGPLDGPRAAALLGLPPASGAAP